MRLRRGYYRVLNCAALAITALVLYALGVRGGQLLAGTWLGWLPVSFLMQFITAGLFPPDLEATGDFRGILHPVDADHAEDVFDREMAAEADESAETQPASSNHPGMFALLHLPRTLEGLALRAGAGVLLVWFIWVAAEPLVHRLFPRHVPHLGSTLAGPATFPVTIRIGEAGVVVANGATEPWNSQLALGIDPTFITSVFSVESRQTRALSYPEFRGTDERVDVDAVRRAARERVMIDCREPSGRSHLLRF